MLTRDAILALDDLPRQEVHVPEWKGSVYVRALTVAERVDFEALVFGNGVTDASLLPLIVAMCAVDGEGERLFSADDAEALSRKNVKAIQRVANAALAFNAMTDEALAEGKDDSGKSPA
jgi:hypothetical protein